MQMAFRTSCACPSAPAMNPFIYTVLPGQSMRGTRLLVDRPKLNSSTSRKVRQYHSGVGSIYRTKNFDTCPPYSTLHNKDGSCRYNQSSLRIECHMKILVSPKNFIPFNQLITEDRIRPLLQKLVPSALGNGAFNSRQLPSTTSISRLLPSIGLARMLVVPPRQKYVT